MEPIGLRAVILAGGKGVRLRPYTAIFPKGLVPINDVPILEIVLRQLKFFGFSKVTLAVGHLAQLVETYFGDGSSLGIDIAYSKEQEPLGTAGPLSLISDLTEPFLVMNSDVLTSVRYSDLVEFHARAEAIATIGMYRRDVEIDFGVIDVIDGGCLAEYHEKPRYTYNVSMGVYVFDPRVIEYIPRGKYFDFPDLVRSLVEDRQKVMCFPFAGYWVDIGLIQDYAKAIEEFDKVKHELNIGM